jgi:hypothetical protein
LQRRPALPSIDKSAGTRPARHVSYRRPRQGKSRAGGAPKPADDEDYCGLVDDDVDDIRGELVKLRVTVNCHVLSARRGLGLVAAATAVRALSEAVLGGEGAGR